MWILYSGKKKELVTNLSYIKPIDPHQHLHASSCHIFYSKTSISYIQELPLNRICSEKSSYKKRCNKFLVWVKERGCSDKFIKQQIHKDDTHKKKDVRGNMKDTKMIIS